MDEVHDRLVAGDDVLRLEHQRLALGGVDLLALSGGDLVIGGVDVADEIVTVLGRARMKEVVGELVGIAALGAADHLPGCDVPFVALVPDEVGHLLPGHYIHLDVEAELAPFLSDELDGLELLRLGCLRPAENDKLTYFIAACERR